VVCTASEDACERDGTWRSSLWVLQPQQNQSWHSTHLCLTGTLPYHKLAQTTRGSAASTLQEGYSESLCAVSMGTGHTLIEM
jgi:hypothetical protein